jgi:hypothetical protein
MYLQILAALAALAVTVSAHGYVDNVTVAGVFYEVNFSLPEPRHPYLYAS